MLEHHGRLRLTDHAGLRRSGRADGPQPGAARAGVHRQHHRRWRDFPQPVYEQWTQDYNKENSGIRISYAGGGSGQGIKDVTANIVSFAGSDAPMTDDEKKAAEDKNGTPILEIPTVFGGILMAYHVGGVDKPINFSPEVIGRMFTGQISRWDDAALKADNPDLNLPGTDITVVHRSDSSGTTNAFTSWLCDVSSDWKDKLGTNCKGKEVAHNAIKFSRPGGEVRIGWETRGRFIRFLVIDAGIGIPATHLPRIFERFYKVDRSRSRDTPDEPDLPHSGSAGLGLAIVRHIGEAHGGSVGAESVEGSGSTFWLDTLRAAAKGEETPC